MWNYLKARWGEVSSIIAASGLTGIAGAYLTGALTAQQAEAAAAMAVVAYILPETKGTLPPVPLSPSGAQPGPASPPASRTPIARMLAPLAALLLTGLVLSACGAAGGGDLVNLANDPNSGCVGGGNAVYGGAYLCHIGHGSGDSCEVTMSACKITAAGAASASVNPLAALPAGAQMSVQMPAPVKP